MYAPLDSDSGKLFDIHPFIYKNSKNSLFCFKDQSMVVDIQAKFAAILGISFECKPFSLQPTLHRTLGIIAKIKEVCCVIESIISFRPRLRRKHKADAR